MFVPRLQGDGGRRRLTSGAVTTWAVGWVIEYLPDSIIGLEDTH